MTSTRMRWLAPAAVAAVLMAGCGPKTPDYQSLWTTSATTTTSASDEPLVPFAQYLEKAGITGSPVAPDKLTDLTVTVPSPPGWQPYSNPNLAAGTRTIAKGATYPTAMLLVFQLTGDLDEREALKHADADAEMSEKFEKLNGSKDDFKGFPSSMIEGTYDLNGQRMQSYNRIVLATGKPPAANTKGLHYLVQLTVTTFANEAREQGPDIEAIIAGFNVAST